MVQTPRYWLAPGTGSPWPGGPATTSTACVPGRSRRPSGARRTRTLAVHGARAAARQPPAGPARSAGWRHYLNRPGIRRRWAGDFAVILECISRTAAFGPSGVDLMQGLPGGLAEPSCCATSRSSTPRSRHWRTYLDKPTPAKPVGQAFPPGWPAVSAASGRRWRATPGQGRRATARSSRSTRRSWPAEAEPLDRLEGRGRRPSSTCWSATATDEELPLRRRAGPTRRRVIECDGRRWRGPGRPS